MVRSLIHELYRNLHRDREILDLLAPVT